MKQTEKSKYRIGHVAEQVGVEKFVIRFWEKEFKVLSNRTDGGQRFYEDTDIEFFKQIKQLLYDEGMTIAGARKMLEKNDESSLRVTASQKTEFDNEIKENSAHSPEFIKQMAAFKKQLIQFKELL